MSDNPLLKGSAINIGQLLRQEQLDDPDLDEAVWKPMDSQIGGDHYKKLKIQPMRYSMENKLDALQHTVVKYVTRFRDKGGAQDLEKAKHCIDMLIQFELTGNLE